VIGLCSACCSGKKSRRGSRKGAKWTLGVLYDSSHVQQHYRPGLESQSSHNIEFTSRQKQRRPFQWRNQEFFSGGGSTNSVEDRGLRERGSGGGSPLVRSSALFAIWFDFVKLSGCRGLLRMYFPRNWEFGPALSKIRNFGGV
jgi:hypothetical protein